jgi:hypothetical protein
VGGSADTPAGSVEFGQLLGFESVADEGRGVVDFKDETFGDKLGAKIGPIESNEPVEGPAKPRR